MKKLDAKSLDAIAGGCCKPACPPPCPPPAPCKPPAPTCGSVKSGCC